MYEQISHSLLNAILDDLRPEIRRQDLRHFYTRLGANFYTIYTLFRTLYGNREDFRQQIVNLVETMASGYIERSAELERVDMDRELDHNWFLSQRWVGMALYTNGFADNLAGLINKIGYFKELGINMVHIMPILKCPAGSSDGGYAVSDFRQIDDQHVADRLVVEGVDPDSAAEAAEAAGGNLDRARVLAADPELAARRRLFADVPHRLDGTGSVVMQLVDELLGKIEAAAAPLARRHAAEVAELDERIARYGERGSGKKALDERHKRELRRHRTDELLAGLTVIAGTYRDVLVDGRAQRPEAVADAVVRIHQAMEAFERNPNESLLLQSLLWSLPVL